MEKHWQAKNLLEWLRKLSVRLWAKSKNFDNKKSISWDSWNSKSSQTMNFKNKSINTPRNPEIKIISNWIMLHRTNNFISMAIRNLRRPLCKKIFCAKSGSKWTTWNDKIKVWDILVQISKWTNSIHQTPMKFIPSNKQWTFLNKSCTTEMKW
jgi:hypothetical protein